MDARDECFNLAGQTSWRVFYSEDHAPGARVDPWNLELRGPGGSAVYPDGGMELCAYSPRRGLWSRLETFGRVVQRGDSELVVCFPADRLAEVAELLRIYRKRSLSPERRAKAGETLRAARDSAGNLAEPAPTGPAAARTDVIPERGKSIAPERGERVMPEKATRSEEGGTDEPR